MPDSTALVTGASGGISKQIAHQLAAAGAVRLALLPDDGPTGEFFSWDGTTAPW
jgi:NAD(P)-dependent dehydrogenase (short-subunit alcohol dehydrogenase family)